MRMETSFSESAQTFDAGFVEVNEVEVLQQAYKAGDHIKITDDGIISVLTADEAEADNTRPITSAAVAAR